MRLNVVDRGPDAGDASDAAPIVLVHGLFGRARNMSFFQKRLAAHRRVLAVDLRNHGDSPHGLMDYAGMASDLAETLDSLGAAPAIVLGHSMGGKAAMVLALTRPELVAALLVADMPPAAIGHGNAALANRLLALPLPATLNRAGADALLSQASDSAEVRGLLMQNMRLGENAGWTIGLAEIAASMPAIEGWPEAMAGLHYDGPTLFVAGERSPYIAAGHHVAMRTLFPNHRLEIMPGAGHWLHAEKPAQFLDLVAGFAGVAVAP